mgnify:FL=1
MKNNIFNMLKNFKNPKDAVMNIVANNNNNTLKNMINLANENNNEELLKIAKNLCKEKGIDFDKDFQEFMKMFK